MLVAPLLSWFYTHARDLPWRRTLDPYAVWVSEIMLQQTQVKTVIPYYERWMRELPTIQSLAEASSEKIHKLWEGLGYYTRVRNMQKAAQTVMQQRGGVFPSAFDDVLALSGIGRYTAGAICSIAFNARAPILDGNVIRVLTRVFGIRENARMKETNAQLWQFAEELVTAAAIADGQSPMAKSRTIAASAANSRVRHSSFVIRHFLSGPCSALNQSLMELGATVCTPKQPKCNECPVTNFCVAQRKNLIDQLPNLGERAAATARRFAACVIERDGAVLVRQRPVGVVNAHLWEFPNVEVALKSSATATHAHLETELGCVLDALTPLATVKHTITRYRITLEAFVGRVNGRTFQPRAGEWMPLARARALPFTSAHGRILRRIADGHRD